MAQQPAQQQQQSSAVVIMPDENTIDESIFKTIGRDVLAMGRNLRSVLIPINWKFANRDQALRNWDLWGPLVGVHARTHCLLALLSVASTARHGDLCNRFCTDFHADAGFHIVMEREEVV